MKPEYRSAPEPISQEAAKQATLEEWRHHFQAYHRKKRISIERLADGNYRYPAVHQRWQAYYAHRVRLLEKSGNVLLAKLMDESKP